MAECYSCKDKVDTFGNYVECGLIAKTGSHLFVDWWYWNNGRPDECPKKDKESNDERVDKRQ